MLPWLLRSYFIFGNPFHIAGSAGLLRSSSGEPATYSFLTFLREYGVFFPFKRILWGFINFWKPLQFYEHGLQIVPLFFTVIGLIIRKRFYNPFVSSGFLITFILCCYVCYSSWAGVRYFSSFLPFVYAYGVHTFIYLLEKWGGKRKYVGITAMIIFCVIVLSFIFYPHRFYERKYAAPPPDTEIGVSKYIKVLKRHLKNEDHYMADGLCQLNFLADRNCVGLQGYNIASWLPSAFEKFNPKLLAFTHAEAESERGEKILNILKKQGYRIEQKDSCLLAIFYSVSLSTSTSGSDSFSQKPYSQQYKSVNQQ